MSHYYHGVVAVALILEFYGGSLLSHPSMYYKYYRIICYLPKSSRFWAWKKVLRGLHIAVLILSVTFLAPPSPFRLFIPFITSFLAYSTAKNRSHATNEREQVYRDAHQLVEAAGRHPPKSDICSSAFERSSVAVFLHCICGMDMVGFCFLPSTLRSLRRC